MAQDKKKREHPPFFKSVRNYFREYCNCSSIHGFRYFGEKRTYFERGWWFIVFSLTLVACTVAIREVYLKWKESPVIVNFETSETPIYTIPFPAVTICPQSKSLQEKYNHTLMWRKYFENKNYTQHEQKLVDYMAMICDKNGLFNYSSSDAFDPDDFFRELVNVNVDYYDYMMTHVICEYMGEKKRCNKLLRPIITDEGICFTFNMLDRSEIFSDKVVEPLKKYHSRGRLAGKHWSMENGYSKEAGLHAYPRRALLAGARNSLQITLITRKEQIDFTCRRSIHGFRVLLHIPIRTPRLNQQYFMVPLDQVVIGAILPSVMTTSDSVKNYDPKKRKCYFPSERNLTFFKEYTSLNCKLECLSNYTLRHCGCVKYFMPRENTTKICGMGKWDCMIKAEHTLQMGDLHSKIEEPSNNTNEYSSVDDIPNCDCMPICTDLTYYVETSQNNWDWLHFTRGTMRKERRPINDSHRSMLILFFKSSHFVASVRHEFYGPTDFLANFGGLLGLFTGFSVLSIMEAIYFLTVRLCCNSRLYGYWAGPEI